MTRTLPILAALLLAGSAHAQGHATTKALCDGTLCSSLPPDHCIIRTEPGACLVTYEQAYGVTGVKTISSPSITAAIIPQSSLAVAYPPCGTPEAANARMCIVWKVLPCPSKMQPQDCGPLLCAVTQPIGCEP